MKEDVLNFILLLKSNASINNSLEDMEKAKDIFQFSKEISLKLKEKNFQIKDTLKSLAYLIYALEYDLLKALKKENSKFLIPPRKVFLNKIDVFMDILHEKESNQDDKA